MRIFLYDKHNLSVQLYIRDLHSAMDPNDLPGPPKLFMFNIHYLTDYGGLKITDVHYCPPGGCYRLVGGHDHPNDIKGRRELLMEFIPRLRISECIHRIRVSEGIHGQP